MEPPENSFLSVKLAVRIAPAMTASGKVKRRVGISWWKRLRRFFRSEESDVARAEELISCGELTAAAELLASLDGPTALRLRAMLLHRYGALEEAQRLLERAIDSSPDFAEAHNTLGCVLQDRRLFDDAEAAFTRAVAGAKDYSDPLVNRGALRARLGRFVEALDDLAEAVKRDSGDVIAWHSYGNLLAMMEYYDRAKEAFETALALRPGDAQTCYWIGASQAAAGETEEAVKSFRHAVRQEPTFSRARYNLALCLERAGRSAEAAAERITALEEDPQLEPEAA